MLGCGAQLPGGPRKGVCSWFGVSAGRRRGLPDPSLITTPVARTRSARVRARWGALPGNLRGGIWFLAGAAILTVMTALVKLAGQRLHVTEILFFRQITMVAVSLPVIFHGLPGSLKSQRPDLQLLRVGLAFGAMMLGFTAVIHLPLAEVTTLGFTKTFFMTILGIFLLGEAVRIRRWAALAVGFSGVLIILWPTGEGGFNIYGVASISSACLVAMVMVLIRRLSQFDRPVTILSYQAIGVGVRMFVPMLWFWKTPTLWEVGLMVLILAAGFRRPAGVHDIRGIAGKPGAAGCGGGGWRGALYPASGTPGGAPGCRNAVSRARGIGKFGEHNLVIRSRVCCGVKATVLENARSL
jgi:drug/metabolite transporter (DMT)-like permease